MSAFGSAAAQVVLVVLLAAVAVWVGELLVLVVFRWVDRGRPRRSLPLPGLMAAAQSLPGGVWIGWLERLAVYTTLLAGYPDGVALALAVKGLARYPELKAPSAGAAERFIIGTFVSVLAAGGCALLARWATGLL